MTEKRLIVDGDYNWVDTKTGTRIEVEDAGTLMDIEERNFMDYPDEAEQILNQLYEENQELYNFRLLYNALLFNEWYKNGIYEVYKSKKHENEELCFNGKWFIVVAILPSGQITNHYHIDYWGFFQIPSYDKVKGKFDNHTSKDVLNRLLEVI